MWRQDIELRNIFYFVQLLTFFKDFQYLKTILILFFRMVLLRFLAKLKEGRETLFPALTYAQPLHYQYPPPIWYFVAIDEPTWTHHHLKFIVYITVHLVPLFFESLFTIFFLTSWEVKWDHFQNFQNEWQMVQLFYDLTSKMQNSVEWDWYRKTDSWNGDMLEILCVIHLTWCQWF